MTQRASVPRLPSVDKVLGHATCGGLIGEFGRTPVVDAIRAELAGLRSLGEVADIAEVVARCRVRLEEEMRPSLRRVFNLTGTVLHTNLGRAALPEIAIAAAAAALREATNLEFDLATGRRGERETHLRRRICRLTGAEAATVVNNNAAAVFLLLNTLALRREVPVSRGELIEIGGSFRLPDIMSRAGCRLIEVGTTNRTHLRDYEEAIGPRTALILAAHPSNYAVTGFTASPPHRDIAALARARTIPFAVDLGSGALIDLARFGLPHEPTPMDALAAGADLVTFSGDKLLGGPQAGIIVGRADLVRKIDRNPLKRIVRLDKARIAALEAVLKLYADPGSVVGHLPTLRILTRSAAEIERIGRRLLPRVAALLGGTYRVELQQCLSQIGSGSLPVDRLPSHCLALQPRGRSGGAVNALAADLRGLPVPIIGRIHDGWMKLDLRCLDDEAGLLAALEALPRA